MKIAVLAELLAVFFWALGNIFVAYLSMFFDNYTQNFFRFVSAGVALLVFSLLFKKEAYLNSLRRLKTFLIPIATVFTFQIFIVYGIVFTTPTVATLITRLSIVFVDILAFFLFPEERAALSKKGFTAGTAMSFIGVSGVVLTGSGLSEPGGMFIAGVFFLLLASILWAVYTVSMKIALRNSDPLSATANIFLFSGIMYLPFSTLTGGIYEVLKAGPAVNLLLAVSGILAIGVANFLNYYAIQRLGASLPANLQILLPVFTGVISMIVLREEMQPLKIFFSVLTLIGSWVIVRASEQAFLRK
ncbi:MAG: DMT family transporter [Candidatus Brockarchaeota archaeon]|nr:DMT family transporter [Candidatus Brockarchaeota archaeon]